MLKRLKIWQKFTLIAVAFSLPIIVLLYFLILESNKAIEFTRVELDGTQYLRPLRKLAVDVAAHRDLASAVLAGDASFKGDLDKRQEMIEADFKEIADRQARYELAAPEDLDNVRTDWQTIKSGMSAAKGDASYEQHTRYLAKIYQFTVLIGNTSNLILDSDVDSHYLVDALVFRVPKLTAEISAARAYGVAFSASGGQGEVNTGRKGALAEAAVKINDALFENNHFLRFAAGKAHPRTDEALSTIISDNSKAVNGFNTLLTDKVVNGTGEVLPVKTYFAAASAPLDTSAKLWEATISELDRLLGDRNALLTKNRMLEIGIVVAALLLTIVFLVVVVRAITRPIAHLSEVADRISLGDMDATINVDTKDEIGELGERFRRLQVSLKAAMDALERQDGTG
jgi:methyl-accepting chemotaxis protein